jgi:Rps23 Pro-64 3,4-dihydroxylase Tpa1-like proline 4-hydroxylase
LAADHVVLDDAFPEDLADALLDRALSREDSFAPTLTIASDTAPDPEIRRSHMLPDDPLGPLQEPFTKAVSEMFETLCEGCGMKPFNVDFMETELAAHRDGDFYKPHLDIRFGERGRQRETGRVLSMVSYFHRRPAQFSGGELRLFDLRGSGHTTVEARHNRVIAFPSILLHEVRPVSVPGNAWDDARFSVNCCSTAPIGTSSQAAIPSRADHHP